MKRVFVGQTAIQFELQCNVDVTGALERKIKYMKPKDSVVYEWGATSSNDTAGHIYYDVVLDTELDVAGKWKFWSWIKFADGRVAAGDPQTYEIFAEGTL